jgi:hypothetical protein
MFKRGAWRPNTSIAGSPVLEEANKPRFVMLKYLIRGAHLIPIFCTKEGQFFLNDDTTVVQIGANNAQVPLPCLPFLSFPFSYYIPLIVMVQVINVQTN